MSEYITEVSGTNSLENIQLAIAGEEATGAEFIYSRISLHEGTITNLVTFKDLPPGERPSSRLRFIKQGEVPPDGKTSVWEGVMLVAGTNEALVAYR